MAEQSHSLMTFYQGWKTYNQSLMEVIAPLTPDQLDLAAAPHHWTVGMIAQHMIGNRVWWFQVWMGAGAPDLAPIAQWDPANPQSRPIRSASELVAGLERTWAMIEDALTRWTPADLSQVFPCPPEVSEEEREIFANGSSRQWIIWHVLEHEIHHGGELSLALGQQGLAGVYGAF